MNQFEYKKRYDPRLGMYVKKHVHSGEIHGGSFNKIFKSVASDLFGKRIDEAVKTASKKALHTAALKTGEYLGKNAGAEIVKLLSKKKNQSTPLPVINYIDERVNRVNEIISRAKKRKIM